MSADNLPFLEIERYLGDSSTLSLPLYHPDTGAAYDPTGHELLFTLKADRDADADVAALVQKRSSIGGITVETTSEVSFVREDFQDEDRPIAANVTYEWDVYDVSANLHVATGTIVFRQVVTREQTASIPISTTNPDLGYTWPNLAEVPDSISALADLTPAADRLAYFTGSGPESGALAIFTAAARALADDATFADMRTTLSVYSIAEAQNYVATQVAALVNSSPAALDTLAELAAALGNDANFATTITNALALKAPLASPALTGVPTAPTAAAGTNTTQLATTAFVGTAVANLVNSSPAALDTLNELAAALGNDANFAATVTTALAGKQALNANLTTLTTSTLGDTVYASATNTLAKLAGNTSATMAVLTQTGNGTVSAAPVWTSTTGTGNVVRATSPTIVTPTIASITSSGDFTVSAASSGASLTLGQGANGGITAALAGTGTLTIPKSTGVSVRLTTNQQPGSAGSPLNLDVDFLGYLNQTMARIRSWDESSSTGYGNLSFWTGISGTIAEAARITRQGNFLIGTTADLTSVAGGLKSVATGAGATATSSTTGQFQLSSAGGTIGMGGGAIYASGSLNGASAVLTAADNTVALKVAGATGKLRVRGYTDATNGVVADAYNSAEDTLIPLSLNGNGVRINTLNNGTITTGTGLTTLGGNLTVSGTTDATSLFSASVVLAGGLSVAQARATRLGGDLYIYGGGANPAGQITANGAPGGLYFTNVGTSTNMRFFVTDGAGTPVNALLLANGTASTASVSVPLTTPGTSTTTGALVVSGGVGVAGRINAGGDVQIAATGKFYVNRANNGGESSFQCFTNGTFDWSMGTRGLTNSNWYLYNNTAGNNAVTVDAATSAISLAATTEATTGGAGSATFAGGIYVAKKVITASTLTTAAGVAYDFGAANVVSPTSPNRTLTVIVGGTTYYIAAKTTND